jgi:hypothetical protein
MIPMLNLPAMWSSTEHALARTDGHGLEELLRAFGQSLAKHARFACLLLEGRPDPVADA